MKTDKRTYSLSIEPHEGGYLARFPALQGCHAWGKTYEDAVNNAPKALTLFIETLNKRGEPIPEDTDASHPVSLAVTVRTTVIT